MNVKDSKIYTTSDEGEGIRFNTGASGSIVDISGRSIIATCGENARAFSMRGTGISFTIRDKSIVTSGIKGANAIRMEKDCVGSILGDVCVYGGYVEQDCICFGADAGELNINTSGTIVGTNYVASANGWLKNAKIERGIFGSISKQKPLEGFSNFYKDYSLMEGTRQEIEFQYLTSDGELQSEKINAYIVEIGK